MQMLTSQLSVTNRKNTKNLERQYPFLIEKEN